MWKTACLVLAASLIFPLLASWAASPDDPPVVPLSPAVPMAPLQNEMPPASLPGDVEESMIKAVVELMARLSSAKTQGRSAIELPEAFLDLPAEHQVLVWQYLAEQAMAYQRLEAQSAPRRYGACLAAGGGTGESTCDFGAAVARMQPCLAAGDCPAVEAWRQAMGQMGVVPAPQTMTRASDRSSAKIERPE